MSKVVNMLTNVQTHEVSLVRRGANNKRFAMTKAKDQPMKLAALIATVLATPAEGEASLVSTMKAAGHDEESIEVAIANFRMQTGFKDKLSKEQLAQVTKASGLEVAPAAPAPAPASAPVAVPVDMPVEMQKAFDEQNDKLKKLEKEAGESKAALETLRKESELKEYVAKCATKFSHVPGMSSEEMGLMLQNAYEVSKDFGAKLEKQWGDTHEAIKKSSLFAAQGIAHSTQAGSSAMGKMETLAKEYVAKDSSLTIDAAMGRVMADHPELYNEYLAENPAQRAGR